MHRSRVAIVVTGLLALAACKPSAPPAVDTSADEATLKAGTTTWLEAYNAGDADRIVALYAEDAVMMPPGAPAASGHAAMKAFLTTDMANAKAAGVTLVDGDSSAGVSGDLGWHSGSYTVKNAAGETVDSGSYAETWRKTADGKWLIIRDIWNSDRPPAAPAAPAEAAAPTS